MFDVHENISMVQKCNECAQCYHLQLQISHQDFNKL